MKTIKFFISVLIISLVCIGCESCRRSVPDYGVSGVTNTANGTEYNTMTVHDAYMSDGVAVNVQIMTKDSLNLDIIKSMAGNIAICVFDEKLSDEMFPVLTDSIVKIGKDHDIFVDEIEISLSQEVKGYHGMEVYHMNFER